MRWVVAVGVGLAALGVVYVVRKGYAAASSGPVPGAYVNRVGTPKPLPRCDDPAAGFGGCQGT